MNQTSLLDQLLSGSALPEQYLGVAILAFSIVVGIVNTFIEARKGPRR